MLRTLYDHGSLTEVQWPYFFLMTTCTYNSTKSNRITLLFQIKSCFSSLLIDSKTKVPYVCILQQDFFTLLLSNGIVTNEDYPSQRSFKTDVLDHLGAGCRKANSHFPYPVMSRMSYQIPRQNFLQEFQDMLDKSKYTLLHCLSLIVLLMMIE